MLSTVHLVGVNRLSVFTELHTLTLATRSYALLSVLRAMSESPPTCLIGRKGLSPLHRNNSTGSNGSVRALPSVMGSLTCIRSGVSKCCYTSGKQYGAV